jgi:hypothetical protein
MLSGDIFVSVSVKECCGGDRRRESQAIPYKPQLKQSFLSGKDVVAWLNSWQGYRQVSVTFLSLARRNTEPLAPYKSPTLAINADYSTLQHVLETASFNHSDILITQSDKFSLVRQCSEESNHVTLEEQEATC